MPIETKCACGATYRVDERLAGRAVRCRRCGKPMTIPGNPPAKPPEPPDPKTATAKAKPGTATTPGVCPGCGAPLPAKAQFCGECGYNPGLGRTLSLTKAVKEAMEAERARDDGTRLAIVDQHAAERAKVDRASRIAWRVIPIALLLAAILVAWIVAHRVKWREPLDERLTTANSNAPTVTEPLTRVEDFHPYRTGWRVEVAIPRRELFIETLAVPANARGIEMIVEALALPYTQNLRRAGRLPQTLPASDLARFFDEQRGWTGVHSPGRLEKGIALPDGKSVIWRQGGRPTDPGYLTGAAIEFSGDALAHIKTLEEARPYYSVRLEGRLRFVATRGERLAGRYALALSETMDRLPTQAKDKKGAAATGRYFFHPVIVVDPDGVTVTNPGAN